MYCPLSYSLASVLCGVFQLLNAHQAMSSTNSAELNIASSLVVVVVVCKSGGISQNLRWIGE